MRSKLLSACRAGVYDSMTADRKAFVTSVLGDDRGVVGLVGTPGVYQLVAMMMVVDQFPLPDGVAPELESLPRGSLGEGGALR